ncbi:hypothetical protein RUM43_001586 [Polyplax serrata]|uniref:Uncharacterized protein n=1 Tax=Polyplax serrata TaxID=468196 RepID=A0AAN8XQZ3_POLSC
MSVDIWRKVYTVWMREWKEMRTPEENQREHNLFCLSFLFRKCNEIKVMDKMDGKMKMVSFITVLLVGVAVTAPVASSEGDESTLPKTDVRGTTLNVEATANVSSVASRGQVSNTKWTEKVRKPFLYGKKFELKKQFNVNRYGNEETRKSGGLVSPLITRPIRPLPYVPSKNTLNKSQNDILNSVRESLRESNEEIFNKTYFTEDASESENNGGEVTTPKSRFSYGNSEEGESKGTSRQNADRSLMVVLPYNPTDNDSVEELFTKKPLIKLVETSADFQRKAERHRGNTTPLTREPDILTTTEFDRKSFLTRRPWRPSKRTKVTTEAYQTTTENGEDITKTYTNYNDVEQVTKKFQNFASTKMTEQVSNHNYDVDIVTSTPLNPLRNKFFKGDSEEVTTSKGLDEIEMDEEVMTANYKPKRKNQKKASTTTKLLEAPKHEEITKVLEILPGNMKDVIIQLGLNKGKEEQNQEKTDEKEIFELKRVSQPTIDPKSYSVFKPIPLEVEDGNKNVVSEDMKTFLASFGLLPVLKRDQKSFKSETEGKQNTSKENITQEISEANLNFLPDDLKLVLSDMGLVKSVGKKDSAVHIFKPSNHTVAKSDEDFEKVNAILSSIKTTVNESKSFTVDMQSEIIQKIKELNNLRYSTGNITEINKEIQKIILNKFPKDQKPKTTKRATKLAEGPDPLIFTDENISRNDVKRQESNSKSSTSSSSSSSSSSSTSGGSSSSSASSSSSFSNGGNEESKSLSDSVTSADEGPSSDDDTTTTEETPNLEALKDSFGGGETASDTEDVDSALPPKRPNGLYLLLDWNSFLEVGTEDDKRRVNLRFQPKIGDSRNFLPISVP